MTDKTYIIEIEWEGPLSLKDVIKKRNDWGEKPDYAGNDYGLYQIYGRHILCGNNTLLYIGKAIDQTFARRFRQHSNDWLKRENKVKIYLGRTANDGYYTGRNNWVKWKRDIGISEQILIYKYTPNYNSSCLGDFPKLLPHKKVKLIHSGRKGKLSKNDNAPKDYK